MKRYPNYPNICTPSEYFPLYGTSHWRVLESSMYVIMCIDV